MQAPDVTHDVRDAEGTGQCVNEAGGPISEFREGRVSRTPTA
jgi:hypothetical protein